MVRTRWRRRAPPPAPQSQAGFTLAEVLAAGVVLSAITLCLIRAWTVFDVMSLDLQVRQKAVFILNGEMERLSGLYTVGGFGGKGPVQQLQAVSEYPAISGIPNSANRLVYGSATSSAQGFTTASFSTFKSANTPDNTVLISGSGASTTNFVWIDRARNILGRLSWVACPTADYATSGAATASACWNGATVTVGKSCLAYTGVRASGSTNSGGDTCYLLTVLLEYPYRATGSTPVDEASLPGSHLSSSILTLSTLVGRWA